MGWCNTVYQYLHRSETYTFYIIIVLEYFRHETARVLEHQNLQIS